MHTQSRATPCSWGKHTGQETLPKSFIGLARPGAALRLGSHSRGLRSRAPMPISNWGRQPPLIGYFIRSFRYSQPSLVYSQALEGATDRADITVMMPVGREEGPRAWSGSPPTAKGFNPTPWDTQLGHALRGATSNFVNSTPGNGRTGPHLV